MLRGPFSCATPIIASRVTIAASSRGEPDDGTHYYVHWLAALEKLVAGKKLILGNELERRVDEWDAAARSTPHGKPIELPICQGSPRRTIPPKFS